MAKTLDKFRNSEGKIWLNVASSTNVLQGFINLDNHILLRILFAYPALKPFVPAKYREVLETYRAARRKAPLLRHDCRRRLFLPDESVDHILCSHFLEHVFPPEAAAILADFHRVLKKDGTLHIVVPDLEAMAEHYLERKKQGVCGAADDFVEGTLLSGKSRGSLKFRMLEFLGAYGLRHHWMYDRASLSKRLRDLSFSILEANETPSRDYRLHDGSVHVLACKP